MKLLIKEDCLFERVSSSVFYSTLLEYLTKNDNIKYADDYIKDFDASKKQTYAKQYPISDIKEDLFEFIKDWIKEVESLDDVYKIIDVHMSRSYGFSNYIEIALKRPKDRRLQDFYQSNRDKYDHAKFRFSEHDSRNDDSDIADHVNFVGKSFNQAADEMLYLIQNYITDLHSQEKQYLKKLDKQNKKRR